MAVSEDFTNYILDQLSEFGEVTHKKMFGGVGFFREGLMFAMIGGGSFRLKVDEYTQPDFEKYEMEPFYMGKDGGSLPYWEVPVHVLEDKSELKIWAARAFEVALRKRSKKKKKK